ncbi:hypothetical protein [Enterococcus crotali]|uniref:hypothetical protein n=1 Tax=Enterococcus crotali TaxID=1453587 RepID=UPI000472B8DB|nr:hypothetical protein [Enterococcus crotali]
MQRSSSGVFLLLAVLPIDRVKDILKSAKLMRNGDYTLDAIKLTAKEWEALKEFERSADVVKTVDRGKDVGKAGINFGSSEKLEIHFSKHGSEMKQALNKKNYTIADYLSDANHVINEGQFVPEMNGYIKLISGEGSAKYAFVGLDRTTGNITTLHLKSVKEQAKKAPSLGLKP